MKHWLAVATMFALIGPAGADTSVQRTVIVTGGERELANVIVAVPMEGVSVGPYWETSLTQADGTGLMHQFLPSGRLGRAAGRPELLVLLSALKAGERRTLTFWAGSIPNDPLPPRMSWHDAGEGTIELRLLDGARPVARFTRFTFDPNAVPKDRVLTNPTIKPYHHVFAADGKTLLTNGPEGKYPHHRGIFFGFNRITYDGKKADVWHGQSGESQRVVKDSTTDGNLLGLHRLKIGWHGADGPKFADEERELAFFPMSGGLLVEFRSKLTTDRPGGVKLDGDPQHAGFHFRANAAVETVDKQTYFLRPDGKGKEGEERNWDPKTRKGPVNLPWNAMCFVLDGKRRTAVYLDHPDNPKEARQSERTYGRIGTYFEYTLTAQKPLFVRHRLWIQDGEMTVGQCAALSRSFVEPVKVEVKSKE